MQRASEIGYGVARLAFGASLMAFPRSLGRLLLGDEALEPAVRISLRTYATRDVVLGLGTLRAVARGGDVDAWLVAGTASDALDAAVQVGEWGDLPPDKRMIGVLSALGAAAGGLALLVGRERS